MPHFLRSFTKGNKIGKEKKKKAIPLHVPDFKPVKQATAAEIFGSALKLPKKKKSVAKS